LPLLKTEQEKIEVKQFTENIERALYLSIDLFIYSKSQVSRYVYRCLEY